MRRVLDKLDLIIRIILVVFLGVMIVVGTMQVVYRYVIEESLSWSEELLRFMYVWVTMIGVSLGIRRKSFAAIDSFLDIIEKRSKLCKKALQIVAFAVQIVTFMLLLIYGTKLVFAAGIQTAPALMWPMKYIYLAFPIGSILSLIFTAEELYYFISGKKKEAV